MPRRKIKITEEENQKPFFFDSFNVTRLCENSRLPGINLLKKSYDKKSEIYSLKFKVPQGKGLINIYLFVNGIKKDMFYQVNPGNHSFSFFTADTENLIEIFYTRGNYRSPRTTFIL